MRSFLTLGRAGVLTAILGVWLLVSGQAVAVNPDAESFAQRLIDQGVEILRNNAGPPPQVAVAQPPLAGYDELLAVAL